MSRAQNEHARAPRGPQPVPDRSLITRVTAVPSSEHRSAPDRARAEHLGASLRSPRCHAVAVTSGCPADALSVLAKVTDETPEGP